MKYTKIPVSTFSEMQLNAGVLTNGFDTSNGTVEDIIGATSGGINFEATPEFKDLGEGIDNAPKDTKELKQLQKWAAHMAGTFKTVTVQSGKQLVGAADVSGEKITPRNDLKDSDFEDIWFVGDYSNLNGETNGGFCAIHLMNALSTGGFKIQTSDRDSGSFAFDFTGHYSIEAQDTPPFEIYIKAGTEE